MIIGAQKSGTSSLLKYLTANFMIGEPFKKEVHYFDFNSNKNNRWYHSHFSFSTSQLTGEASPFYLYHPDVPKRVKKYHSKIKLIAILRDPVERAWSQYSMNINKGLESLGFKEALLKEEERLLNADFDDPQSAQQLYSYKTRGLYAQQLNNWYQHFPMEQLMVMSYHQFYSNPWHEVQKIYRFLNVAPYMGSTLTFKENQTPQKADIDSESKKLLMEYYKQPNLELKNLTGITF